MPRPTFVRPTSTGGCGDDSTDVCTSSSVLISPPNYHNSSKASKFNISTREFGNNYDGKLLPNGSPYHRLRDPRVYNENNRRRPISVHLNESSDTFLDWSADTIVSHFIGMRLVETLPEHVYIVYFLILFLILFVCLHYAINP